LRADHAAVLASAREYPAGRLREEREAQRLRALDYLGCGGEARLAVEHFRCESPFSVLVPKRNALLAPSP
jgi:hypothetical protein